VQAHDLVGTRRRGVGLDGEQPVILSSCRSCVPEALSSIRIVCG
jgi:hypothetical protein